MRSLFAQRNGPGRRPNDLLPAGLNAMTFDVEEWFHARNLNIPRDRWGQLPSRLDGPINAILDLMYRHDARGTFFMLGWVASRLPKLVRKIHAAGHEIASHGYLHQSITTQTAAEFRRDLRVSKSVIEDIIGEPILGYRAPNYSMSRRTFWALDVLAELGFRYDSSIYPVRSPHGRYGMPGTPLRPYRISRHLWEFPLPTVRILGSRVPAATGGYLRNWPFLLTQRAFEQNARKAIPVVVNVHPWELDADQPRSATSWLGSWLHYGGLGVTQSRLVRLLNSYRFLPLRALLECCRAVSQATDDPSEKTIRPACSEAVAVG